MRQKLPRWPGTLHLGHAVKGALQLRATWPSPPQLWQMGELAHSSIAGKKESLLAYFT